MTKQGPIRAFTYTYRNIATATFTPTTTVTCEGMEASDGSVILKTADKTWRSYNGLDEMFESYSRHGKGTIKVVASTENVETCVSEK